MLFIRGNAISGALTISGTSQFPNPPIIVGITKKKIIMKAWAVTITLYSWSSPSRDPAFPSSSRIKADSAVPRKADQTPNTKYKDPISLWLVDMAHRSHQAVIVGFLRADLAAFLKANPSVVNFIFFLQKKYLLKTLFGRIRSSFSRQENINYNLPGI